METQLPREHSEQTRSSITIVICLCVCVWVPKHVIDELERDFLSSSIYMYIYSLIFNMMITNKRNFKYKITQSTQCSNYHLKCLTDLEPMLFLQNQLQNPSDPPQTNRIIVVQCIDSPKDKTITRIEAYDYFFPIQVIYTQSCFLYGTTSNILLNLRHMFSQAFTSFIFGGKKNYHALASKLVSPASGCYIKLQLISQLAIHNGRTT